jgi:hypothetical protein
MVLKWWNNSRGKLKIAAENRYSGVFSYNTIACTVLLNSESGITLSVTSIGAK